MRINRDVDSLSGLSLKVLMVQADPQPLKTFSSCCFGHVVIESPAPRLSAVELATLQVKLTQPHSKCL